MHFKNKTGFVTLDGRKLYAALMTVKQVQGLSWEQVAAQIGITRNPISHLRDGGSIDATTLLRMAAWLETDVTAFAYTIQE